MPIVEDPYGKYTDDELGKAIKQKSPGAYDEWSDADIGKAMRVKATPQLGEVSKQARKRLANVEAEKTANEYGQDVRDVWAQGVREIGVPIATGAVGLATGGLGLLPAMAAAGGTAAAGEAMVQAGNPTESPFKDIGKAGAIGAASEYGGRFLGSVFGKVAASRAASKAAKEAQSAAEYAATAERLGFPMKNVEGKAGSALQARIDAVRRNAISKEADEIMAPYGSPLTAEMSGQEAAGVFRNIDEHFVGHAREARRMVAEVAGGKTVAPFETARTSATLERELKKRAFRGMDELQPFFSALRDENGGFKHFTVDELLALRTDVGKEMAKLSESNPKKAFLKRLYGAMSDDATLAIETYAPDLAPTFKQANADFAEYFGSLKNEVASRLFNEAKAGNGTAVVSEFFKGAPEDINHVFQFVQKTRPQDVGQFRKTMQQAALQRIFGIADEGSPAIGFKLAERLDKIGADRLNLIFGGSKEASETLGRVRELASLTGHFERSLKMPPDMSRHVETGVKRLMAEAGAALAAKAWGAPYAAARIGAGVLKEGVDLAMAELAARPALFRQFTNGYKKMAQAVGNTSLMQSTRAALTKSGESDIRAALGAAAGAVGVKLRSDAKRGQVEQDKAGRRYQSEPQAISP
jgi:hypothetical protein